MQAQTRLPSVNVVLLDLLFEVPLLLNIDDLKSLSAASKSFREHFVAQVWAVTVTSEEGFALVTKCS